MREDVGPIIEIGKQTNFGKVGAIHLTGGERYYSCISDEGVVSFMPAIVVRENIPQKKKAK